MCLGECHFYTLKFPLHILYGWLRSLCGWPGAPELTPLSRARIVVNELGFKLLCSYQRENQAWRGKRRSRENRQCGLFMSSLLNPCKRKKTSKTGNPCNPCKRPTANGSAVTFLRVSSTLGGVYPKLERINHAVQQFNRK